MAEAGQVGGGPIYGTCEICQEAPSKYRCPGCTCQSCSLSCVKMHKKVSSCTGKRPRAASTFLPMAQLTPEVLLDDYWLLEEAQQSAKLLTKSLPKSKPRMQNIVQKCAQRNTILSLMPTGMKRARQNRTTFNGGINAIVWTVEWILLADNLPEHPVNLKLSDLTERTVKTSLSHCKESGSLKESYLKLLEKEPSSHFPPIGDIELLLKQEVDKPTEDMPSTPLTRRLWPIHSMETTWTLLLANRTIIEFPTIYIYNKKGA